MTKSEYIKNLEEFVRIIIAHSDDLDYNSSFAKKMLEKLGINIGIDFSDGLSKVEKRYDIYRQYLGFTAQFEELSDRYHTTNTFKCPTCEQNEYECIGCEVNDKLICGDCYITCSSPMKWNDCFNYFAEKLNISEHDLLIHIYDNRDNMVTDWVQMGQMPDNTVNNLRTHARKILDTRYGGE